MKYKVNYRSKGEDKHIIVEASGKYEALIKALDLIYDKAAIILSWGKVQEETR